MFETFSSPGQPAFLLALLMTGVRWIKITTLLGIVNHSLNFQPAYITVKALESAGVHPARAPKCRNKWRMEENVKEHTVDREM